MASVAKGSGMTDGTGRRVHVTDRQSPLYGAVGIVIERQRETLRLQLVRKPVNFASGNAWVGVRQVEWLKEPA